MPALVLKQGLDLGLDLDLEMLTEPEPMHVHRRRAEIQLHIHWSTGAESWVSTIRGTIGASERGGPLGGPAGGGPRGGPAGGGPVHSPGSPLWSRNRDFYVGISEAGVKEKTQNRTYACS